MMDRNMDAGYLQERLRTVEAQIHWSIRDLLKIVGSSRRAGA